jgi:hypothetical protein
MLHGSWEEWMVGLINTAGLVLVGPGSEWFWSMAQFFAVVITLLGIYRQLKAQGAANALEKMKFIEDRWDSDWMSHVRLLSALSVKYDNPPKGLGPAMVELANFWETLAGLVEDGHIRLSDVAGWGRSCQMWWALMKPAIEAERTVQQAPIYESWEGLERLMRAHDANRGVPYQLDPTTLPRIVDFAIRVNAGRRRMAQDFKAGVIPAVPEAGVATEPA